MRYTALTPNTKGYDRAMTARVDEVAVFGSASEGFSQSNINCSIADSLDRMVAMNYGNLAMDMLLDGASGLMTALQDGKYTTVGLNSVIEGVKRVDVARYYDAEEYRPLVRRVQNVPMFLT